MAGRHGVWAHGWICNWKLHRKEGEPGNQGSGPGLSWKTEAVVKVDDSKLDAQIPKLGSEHRNQTGDLHFWWGKAELRPRALPRLTHKENAKSESR